MIISSLLYVESRSSTLTIWQYNFLCRIISQSILNTAACILTCNKGNVKHHHLCSLSGDLIYLRHLSQRQCSPNCV